MANKPSIYKIIDSFWRIQKKVKLNTSAVALYFYLLEVNNKTGWKDEFYCFNVDIENSLGITLNTLRTARESLKNAKLINFNSQRGSINTTYSLSLSKIDEVEPQSSSKIDEVEPQSSSKIDEVEPQSSSKIDEVEPQSSSKIDEVERCKNRGYSKKVRQKLNISSSKIDEVHLLYIHKTFLKTFYKHFLSEKCRAKTQNLFFDFSDYEKRKNENVIFSLPKSLLKNRIKPLPEKKKKVAPKKKKVALKKTDTKDYTYLDSIIDRFAQAYQSNRGLVYTIQNLGKERLHAGQVLNQYKQSLNGRKLTAEQMLDELAYYFSLCLNITDKWLHNNMCLLTIATKFNQINTTITNESNRSINANQSATTDEQLLAIIRKNYSYTAS